MSRFGMFGSSAPGRNHLNPLSLSDAILGRDPSPPFLNGLAGPPRTSNAFLGGLAPVAPPAPVYRSFVADGITYNFRVLRPRARPWQKHCIYAWVRNGWPLYVGKAINGATRFSGDHERMEEALALGADALWVTEVQPENYLDAFEQHLIRWCCPVLNKQHNPLA